MIHMNGVHQLDMVSLGCEEIGPMIQLRTAVAPLRPTEAKITPLTIRDVVPDGRQIYQNILQYKLTLAKAAELLITCNILNQVLYESTFESQMWMMFDSNKMLISSGDAYPESTYLKLEKGDYTIRMQVRHEKKDLLEKLNDMSLLVNYKLPTPITVDVYDHYNQAVIGGKKTATMHRDLSSKARRFYVGALSHEKLLKYNLPAGYIYLDGVLQVVKEAASVRRFRYVVAEQIEQNSKSLEVVKAPFADKADAVKPATETSPNKNDKNSSKSKAGTYNEYLETLRDYKCSLLPKICE